MDGVSEIKQYVEYCIQNGMEACSCTDHGYVLGLHDLIEKTKDTSVKGIPGIETYLAPHDEYVYNPNLKRKFDYFHLTLWASNQQGYQNLLALSNASWGLGRVVKKFGQPKPRITWEDLFTYNEGIICGSGCIEGPIVKSYLRGEKDMSAYNAELLIEIFGKKDRLFMEVMPHSVDRDWKTKGVIQVQGENGFIYTFKDTDILDTDSGKLTAKQACALGVEEIFWSNDDRPQENPLSNRRLDEVLLMTDDTDNDVRIEAPTRNITINES
jgi:DNA polymerase-3 subunit alpha